MKLVNTMTPSTKIFTLKSGVAIRGRLLGVELASAGVFLTIHGSKFGSPAARWRLLASRVVKIDDDSIFAEKSDLESLS